MQEYIDRQMAYRKEVDGLSWTGCGILLAQIHIAFNCLAELSIYPSAIVVVTGSLVALRSNRSLHLTRICCPHPYPRSIICSVYGLEPNYSSTVYTLHTGLINLGVFCFGGVG